MKESKEFIKLLKIMEKLRSKNGCPWDKKQTHKTLIPYLLEESYETIDAINKNDKEALKEELGDLLLQAVFHSQIAKEKGDFTINDVIKTLNEKLVSRHPHVFKGKKNLKTPQHVRKFWEKEKKKNKNRESILDGVPQTLPALLRARRLQSKASSIGFKWKDVKSILKKINEELNEVKSAIKNKNKKNLEEEIGDLLFAITSLAYFYKLDPENALQKTNEKFIKRIKKIEKELNNKLTDEEILKLWNNAK